jgi:hypothetical protein
MPKVYQNETLFERIFVTITIQMNEQLQSKQFWSTVREQAGITGLGATQCSQWCDSALKNDLVAALFSRKIADLGQYQIGQYEALTLVHHWLQNGDEIADGTAGQFDSRYLDGYYGTIDDAPDGLREIYKQGS